MSDNDNVKRTTIEDLEYSCYEIIDLYFSLDAELRTWAFFRMNDRTYLYLRTMKDSAGRWLVNDRDYMMGKSIEIDNKLPDDHIEFVPDNTYREVL